MADETVATPPGGTAPDEPKTAHALRPYRPFEHHAGSRAVPSYAACLFAERVQGISNGLGVLMQAIEQDTIEESFDKPEPVFSLCARGDVLRMAVVTLQMLSEEAEKFGQRAAA